MSLPNEKSIGDLDARTVERVNHHLHHDMNISSELDCKTLFDKFDLISKNLIGLRLSQPLSALDKYHCDWVDRLYVNGSEPRWIHFWLPSSTLPDTWKRCNVIKPAHHVEDDVEEEELDQEEESGEYAYTTTDKKQEMC